MGGGARPIGDTAAADWLCTAGAVRERAHAMLALAEAGSLDHFAARLERLGAAADYVVEVTRAAYPNLRIPFHSRWRHFAIGGRDRWAGLAKSLPRDRDERARVRFDLAVTSVLLDAGAGDAWHYAEPATGESWGRSEGLAVASFHALAGGLFSNDKRAPLRADAGALETLAEADLAAAFQASPANPLKGLAGRVKLLRGLGSALRAHANLFGEAPRVGNLYDALRGKSETARSPHHGYWKRCWPVSAVFGRGASRWAAAIWAMFGGMRPCVRTTRQSVLCRSINSRNGSPIR